MQGSGGTGEGPHRIVVVMRPSDSARHCTPHAVHGQKCFRVAVRTALPLLLSDRARCTMVPMWKPLGSVGGGWVRVSGLLVSGGGQLRLCSPPLARACTAPQARRARSESPQLNLCTASRTLLGQWRAIRRKFAAGPGGMWNSSSPEDDSKYTLPMKADQVLRSLGADVSPFGQICRYSVRGEFDGASVFVTGAQTMPGLRGLRSEASPLGPHSVPARASGASSTVGFVIAPWHLRVHGVRARAGPRTRSLTSARCLACPLGTPAPPLARSRAPISRTARATPTRAPRRPQARRASSARWWWSCCCARPTSRASMCSRAASAARRRASACCGCCTAGCST